MTYRSILYATAATFCGFAVTGGGSVALAQDTAANAPVRQLQEVVVTARKKTENLQAVPLAITSLSSATLTAAGAVSLQDLTFLTPGLTYNSNGQQYNSAPVIRGLSDTSGGLASSQNVSIFLDGIYISDPSAIDLALGGLDRIEIVEGPVSGLYGRNAFTGAINYITAAPSQTPHFDVAATLGDYGRNVYEAGASGGILPDVLSGRIAYTYNHLDGTYQDKISGLTANGYDRNDVTASLLYTPNSHIKITPVMYYGDDAFGPPAQVLYPINCGAETSITYCGKLGSNYSGPNIPVQSDVGSAGNNRRVQHYHIDTKLSYDWGTLDLLLGYNHIASRNDVEFTATEYGIPYDIYPKGANNTFAGDPPLPGGPVLAKSYFGTGLLESDSSVEFRYDTPSQYPIRVGFGGYYFKNITREIDVFGISTQNLPAGDAFNSVAQGYESTLGQNAGDINTGEDGTVDYSFVTSGEWDIIPTLTLATAVRSTDESKTQTNKSASGLEKDFHSITSNESLNWKPSKALTVYVSAANGEKAGGFNFAAQSPLDYTYQPETDWDYELGVKSTILDGHLRLDGDIFHTTLNNLIAAAPPSTPGAFATVAKNVGSLTADGVEVKADWVVGGGLVLHGGVAYSDPKFDSGSYDVSNLAACNPASPTVIAACEGRFGLYNVNGKMTDAVRLQGLSPPQSSQLTFNLTAEYRRPTGYKDFDWFARGDYSYQSKEYQGVENLAWIGARNVFNGHIGVQDHRWSLQFYVLNILNDKTPIGEPYNAQLNTFDGPPNGFFGVLWNQLGDLPDPRTYAVRLDFHY